MDKTPTNDPRNAIATKDSGSAPGAAPTLTWPNRSGETYHVQFKNDLSEPAWQEVGGTVIITGNRASLTDPAPASGPRFYRVATY